MVSQGTTGRRGYRHQAGDLTIGAHGRRSTLCKRSRMEARRTKALRDSAWAAHRAAQEARDA